MPVFVLGMHRSGTSTVTRLINLLGVSLSHPNDLMKEQPDNPKGHWESLLLYKLNESILLSLGGNWASPPILPENWWQAPGVQASFPQARAAFASVYDTSKEWCWKDPRNCLMLRYWCATLGCSPVCVFIHRHPLEVAASLQKRNSLAPVHSLELWEFYNHQSLINAQGLPMFVAAYDQILADPCGFVQRLAKFLLAQGILRTANDIPEQSIKDFVSGDLRHTNYDPASLEGSSVTPEQRSFYGYLRELPETTDRFVLQNVPPDSGFPLLRGMNATVGPALAQLRQGLDQALAQLQNLQSSPSFMQTS